jgi:hypothetical protein
MKPAAQEHAADATDQAMEAVTPTRSEGLSRQARNARPLRRGSARQRARCRSFDLISEHDNPWRVWFAANSFRHGVAKVAPLIGAVVALDEHEPLASVEGDLQLTPVRSVVPPDHER